MKNQEDIRMRNNNSILLFFFSLKVMADSFKSSTVPVDCSPPGPSVHGILQEWAAMLSARGSSQPRDWIQGSYNPCICRWVPHQ